MKLVIAATLTCFLATNAFAEITIKDLLAGISDSKTDAQKDLWWADAKGSQMEITGRVTDVTAAGWILNVGVEIDIDNGRGAAGTCYVREEANDTTIATINKGDKVTCKGKFLTYTELFGVTVTLDDSSLKKH